MTESDNDFGDIDDDDMIVAATQLEQDPLSSVEDTPPRSIKRRRLSPGHAFPHSFRGSEDVLQAGISSSQSSEGLFLTQNSGSAQEDQETKRPETPEQKSKSKYRIHIPKNAELPDDTFRTQISRSSESPYRIRAGIWQKRKPSSPAADTEKEPLFEEGVSAAAIAQASITRTAYTLGIKKGAGQGSVVDTSFEKELADLPSDAFSSPDRQENIFEISSQQNYEGQWKSQGTGVQRLAAPHANLRQTTLFGSQALAGSTQPSSQSKRKHNWPLASKDEPPTHHKLEGTALRTWIYPTNLGATRDYQFNIVARGLYHNLLVALPTGLGKTFIAATIMLNWFRWTKDSQIVFVAPTKPLVSQQVEACFNIAGTPRSATTLLTGNTPPGIRAEEWSSKRVFFMTPQTIINDLKTGICDPKRIVLVVVDEAHRATGSYAYVEVVKFLRRFNTSFRVLGLTATPGSSVESVQEVIDGLGISRVEIRTEESIDIRQYVHQRKVETVTFENSDDIIWIMDHFSKVLQPLVDKLRGMNAYWSKDPITLTAYGCMQNRQRWMASDAGRKANMGVKGMVASIFNVLASLAHAIELLKFHGIVPFYHKLKGFQEETMRGNDKGGKYRRQVTEHQHFKELMLRLKNWTLKPDFIGHPKLEHLQGVVLEHFVSVSEGRSEDPDISPARTRIMVFAHYRDSAEEIVRVLNRNSPMIRPQVFVGQAHSSNSEGMDQKKQLQAIEDFKTGKFNTLVATSIGEEGLDIGEVDLIVCYDASASPIRMLQRMGRTGRKRAGNIVVLLMKGKEESSFTQAKDNHEKMQRMIAAGTRFTFHDGLSPRIVPREVQPVVDKRIIDIPIENTQGDLPEPKKRGRPPKRPPKKFHMPDNVRTGFTKASRMNEESGSEELDNSAVRAAGASKARSPTPGPVPLLESVLLSDADQKQLERTYLQVAGENPETVEPPRLDAFPNLQRDERPTVLLNHGKASRRFVNTMRAMSQAGSGTLDRWKQVFDPADSLFISNGHGRSPTVLVQTSATADPSWSLLEDTETVPRVKGRRSISHGASESLEDEPDITQDEELDSDLAGFIDDSAIITGTDSRDNIPSSLSSPPSLQQAKPKPFYLSPERMQSDVESSQDLPEVSTIVQKKRMLASDKNIGVSSAASPLRKRRKAVIESDSDD
ncbi:3'-5' DNA helicase [Thelotrema lepadinum]|nr:3'-5' DNA helicase [Thelotrema lepadinum]